MSATPATNPSTSKAQNPVPQNAAHDRSRPSPDAIRGTPNREGRPFPPGIDPMDYDDGAWM